MAAVRQVFMELSYESGLDLSCLDLPQSLMESCNQAPLKAIPPCVSMRYSTVEGPSENDNDILHVNSDNTRVEIYCLYFLYLVIVNDCGVITIYI